MTAPDDQRQAVENRRRFVRRPMLKSGRILLGDGYALPCVVLNVSEGGAKLKTQSASSCPARFDIEIGGEPARPCRVAWHRDESLGVEFGVWSEGATVADAVNPRERRAFKRYPMLRPGFIVLKGGFATVRCNVLDLSQGGAKLKPIDPASCPREFELHIDDGARHSCVVVRSDRGVLGVRFTDRMSSKP